MINIELSYIEAVKFIEKYNKISKNKNINNFYKIAGDASFRSYYRINIDDKSYIIMFAPPQFEKTSNFIDVATFLLKHKMPAPQIIAIDSDNGLLLLEDFGDYSLSKYLKSLQITEDVQKYQKIEKNLYCKAIDILLNIKKIPHYNFVASYNNKELLREAMLFIDWYLPFAKININTQQIAQYKKILLNLFDNLDKSQQIVVLRDYHSENLMIINQEKIGLLDFQDALIGSPAYDLVSLLEDARRDISPKNTVECLEYYLAQENNINQNILNDYAILSLQRNLKILGIFCRLSLRDNKHHYLQYLDRVKNFVRNRINNNYCQIRNKELDFMKPISIFLQEVINL